MWSSWMFVLSVATLFKFLDDSKKAISDAWGASLYLVNLFKK